MIRFEVCANSYQSICNAIEGGADCAELCEALEVGGVTPSYGTLVKVSKAMSESLGQDDNGCRCNCDSSYENTEKRRFDVRVLIRCRPGNYIYNEDEVETMCNDIRIVKCLGYEGVVVGALTEDGNIDIPAIEKMLAAGQGIKFTFHRAIDACANPMEALETLIRLGFDKVLTSGCKKNAKDGIPTIKEMQKVYGDKINIMAGGGINENNIADILSETGIHNCHASLTVVTGENIYPDNVDNTGAPMTWKLSDLQKIKDFVNIISKK